MQATPRTFREDIQGLRAVAVLLVLAYHLWPQWVPGGYVGVDVFFVISGYLITSLLLAELERTSTLSFSSFYARRARRLLPASFSTLVVVIAAAWLLLPALYWRDTAEEVAASALYIQNWWLSAEAVNYLELESTATAVQHFWSLSVEEQFYLAWPLLLFLVYRASRAFPGPDRSRRACCVFLGLVVLVSFGYSVHRGLSEGAASYFSTFTRVWQLAVGGLLAVVGTSPRGRVSAIVFGLAATAASALLLSNESVYPGFVAAAPTLGTALVIYAGRGYAGSGLTSWLGSAPMQFLGDISYSLYLWHWPLIVFAKLLWTDHLGLAGGIPILCLSIAMAAVSKRFVEDPFRKKHGSAKRGWLVLGAVVASSAVCLALAVGLIRAAERTAIVAFGGDHPGASVMLDPRPLAPPGLTFIPPLVRVQYDVSEAKKSDCVLEAPGTAVRACAYGNPDAAVRVAVVGDSHALHWMPAFQALAESFDFQVTAITKTSCLFSNTAVYYRRLKRGYHECTEWSRNVVEYLKDRKFDLVVVSQSPRHGMPKIGWRKSVRRLAESLKVIWQAVEASGSDLAIIRPTPWHRKAARDCVAAESPPYERCASPTSEVFFDNAITRAATSGGHRLIDFTDLFCRDERCPPIIGGVFVYRDQHHITATYMKTIAPVLLERLALNIPRRFRSRESRWITTCCE